MSDLLAARFHPFRGWLPGLLPVEAHRIRTEDATLAVMLGDAGADIVDRDPEVEIGHFTRLRGDADQAIVSLDFEPSLTSSRVRRAAERAVGSAKLRARALRAGRRMRRLGYPRALMIGTELGHVLRVPGRVNARRRIVEHLPLAAVVVGTESLDVRTVLDDALEKAARAATTPLSDSPVVRAGGIMTIGETHVLRVTIGPARHHLHTQRAALESLRSAAVGQGISERVPWPVAAGKAGIGDWSLEERVRGSPAPATPAGPLIAECVDFLTSLYVAVPDGADPQLLARDVEVVAAFCPADQERDIRLLGEQLECSLADLPRGFGHGDFWGGNLLTDGGRLVGVVDWAAAGPGRLPLVDLLHLHVSAKRWTTNSELGPAVVEDFLPWARAGGGDAVRAYCRRLGLVLTGEQLEGLVVAYWLERVAYELKTFTQRAEPSWINRNVVDVLHAVQSNRYGSVGL